MGVKNVLYCVSIAGVNIYAGTKPDPWWTRILAAESAASRTYIHLVGVDSYSTPKTGNAKDWGTILDTALAFSQAKAKYACVLETGVEPGTGSGGKAGTATSYNTKPDFYQQAQQYCTIQKAGQNRLWGIIYNVGDETTHFYEPETETIAQIGGGGGYSTTSWTKFNAWANHADMAFGTPLLVPPSSGAGAGSQQGSVAFSGLGTLTAAGFSNPPAAWFATVAMSGTGSMTVTGSTAAPSAQTGTVTFSGVGTLSVDGAATGFGTHFTLDLGGSPHELEVFIGLVDR